jgi:hypothetical protein
MADTKIAGQGLAAGIIMGALLDTLVRKGVLTLPEVRETLTNAMGSMGAYSQTPEGFEASQFIANLLRNRFPERG